MASAMGPSPLVPAPIPSPAPAGGTTIKLGVLPGLDNNNKKKRSVFLHASEVAALIGRHKYQPRHDAMLRFFRRIDAAGYQAYVSKPGHEKERTEQGRELFERMSSCNVEVMAAMRDALNHSVVAMRGETVRSAADNVAARIDEAALSVCANMDKQQQQSQLELVKEHCRSSVYSSFGTHREASTTRAVENDMATKIVKDDVYRKRALFEDAHHAVFIGGKVDGVGVASSDGSRFILEVKNRVNRLFGVVPEYERVQVMAYMYITGIPRCILVEQHGESSKLEHEVLFDEAYWTGVTAELQEAFAEVKSMASSS
jgi:hypothetical protein